MADFTNNSGVALAGRITANRDLVTHPNLLKWAYEGKLWTAGVGVENAGIDSLAALADVTPDFGLVTSSSATILILPIMIRMSVHTEGGALNQLQVAVTRAAADCATTMALSAGTAFTAVQNHNVAYMTSPTASAKYTITVSALTNADYQSIMLATQADNPVSGTGGLGFNRGTVFEIDLLATPRILHSGAALFIYTYTGTTDQKYLPAITWAELTADDLR
jgi:hypothetical protein